MIINKQTSYISLLILATIFFYACTKEDTKNGKSYYSEVIVTLANLPGTPDADVWFNGEKLGTILATGGQAPTFLVKANAPGKVSVYKSGTDELIADTLINLAQNDRGNFKLANSVELGIKGWISNRPVAADSVSFQLFNKLSAINYPVASPDLFICTIDENTLEILDTLAVIPGFKNGTLTAVFTFPQYNTDGKAIWHVGKLKDPATGLFIINKGLDLDLFPILTDDFYKGSFSVLTVEDDATGSISINPIQL